MNNSDIQVTVSDEGGNYFIIVDQVKYKCSYSESVILASLLKNKETFFTKEKLAEIGWPSKLVSKNSVPVAIANIRKILKNHIKLDVIINEKSKGYSVITNKVKLVDTEVGIDFQSEAQKESDDTIQNISNEHVETEKISFHLINNKKPLHSINRLIFSTIGYPLFFINIIFSAFIIMTNNYKLDLPSFNIINGKDYIVIHNSNDNDTISSLINEQNIIDSKSITFDTLEEKITTAINSRNKVFFINTFGDRVVIDCIVENELFSYSGDDITSIIDELKIHGCEI